MDAVKEIRKMLRRSKHIRNLGVSFDLNKLIVLLNTLKAEIVQKDQDIELLQARLAKYKKSLCEVTCENDKLTGKCPETCKFCNSASQLEWCEIVKDEVLASIKTDSTELGDIDIGYRSSELRNRAKAKEFSAIVDQVKADALMNY